MCSQTATGLDGACPRLHEDEQVAGLAEGTIGVGGEVRADHRIIAAFLDALLWHIPISYLDEIRLPNALQ